MGRGATMRDRKVGPVLQAKQAVGNLDQALLGRHFSPGVEHPVDGVGVLRKLGVQEVSQFLAFLR